MPKDYIKKLSRFYGRNTTSIEDRLQILWDHMEVWGADDEDVYMQALGESLDGDARLWFDHLAPRSITGYDMFTDLLKKEWGENIDESLEP